MIKFPSKFLMILVFWFPGGSNWKKKEKHDDDNDDAD